MARPIEEAKAIIIQKMIPPNNVPASQQRQKTRDKRQETRDKRQETGIINAICYHPVYAEQREQSSRYSRIHRWQTPGHALTRDKLKALTETAAMDRIICGNTAAKKGLPLSRTPRQASFHSQKSQPDVTATTILTGQQPSCHRRHPSLPSTKTHLISLSRQPVTGATSTAWILYENPSLIEIVHIPERRIL